MVHCLNKLLAQIQMQKLRTKLQNFLPVIKLYFGNNLKPTNTLISCNIGKSKKMTGILDFSMFSLIGMFLYNTHILTKDFFFSVNLNWSSYERVHFLTIRKKNYQKNYYLRDPLETKFSTKKVQKLLLSLPQPLK